MADDPNNEAGNAFWKFVFLGATSYGLYWVMTHEQEVQSFLNGRSVGLEYRSVRVPVPVVKHGGGGVKVPTLSGGSTSGSYTNGHGQRWSPAKRFTARYVRPGTSDTWASAGDAFATKAEAVRSVTAHSGVQTAYVADELADKLVWQIEDGKRVPA